ncbi:partner and localizer of BRCA2 [Aegotheles albertisi]
MATGRPRAGGAAMEGAAGAGPLSGAEREELRAKLALLRREYSETANRLRRARRAERARSHGRGEAAGGAWRQPSPAGCRDNVTPSADRHKTSPLQPNPCPGPDTEQKTLITLKPAPEFSGEERSRRDGSEARSTQPSQEHPHCRSTEPAPEQGKPQTSRSLMKLRRRTKALVSEEGESVGDGHQTSAGGTARSQTAGTEELRSPSFGQSSVWNAGGRAQREPRPALVWREENSCTPPDAALGVVWDVPEDAVPPGAPECFPSVLRDSSHGCQPESPRALALSGEGQGELHQLLGIMSEDEVLPADRDNSVTNESQSRGGNQSGTGCFNPSPMDLALGNAEELLENQQLESQSRLSPPEKVTAPESMLGSCTVVEGLLFPVEYYVRTTRRMSSCQRKVDLDAVILSQLGRSKKSQRSKGKQKDADSDQASQEKAGNDLEPGAMPFLFFGAEDGAAHSSSPQRSPPVSSGSSTSLGSVSQSSATGTRRDRRRSQRRPKGRRKSACRAPLHPVSQELTGSLGLTTPREGSCVLPQECQSEKENCEADGGKSSPAEGGLCAAAVPGSSAAQLSAGPPPGIKCLEPLPEQVQNPLLSSDSLNPGSDTFASHMGGLEANSPVCQADKHPPEHSRSQPLEGACRPELLPATNVPPCRSLRSSARQRASPVPADESRRGGDHTAGASASLGRPAMDPAACSSLPSSRSLQWLAARLGVTDFHLPDEEFGLLKLEKLESSPVRELEVFIPGVCGDGVASEDARDAQMNAEEERLTGNLISPFKNGWPELPHRGSLAPRRDLSTHELLFTPVGSALAGAPTQPESQISSSVFPVVGATPAVLLPVCSEVFPSAAPVPPSPASLRSSQGASAQPVGDGECKDSAVPLRWDSGGAGSAREEEEQGAMFALEAERGLDHKSAKAVAVEEQSESKEQSSCRGSPEQKTDVAEPLTPVPLGGLGEESLQLVSKLKDSSSSCAVDVSTVWWEAAGSRELCVVTACESSVCLWKPLAPDRWGKLYAWQLGDIPVIQIVPLPDTHNLVCIALGDLEIGEIRLLLYSESDSFKQSLLKAGNIKAALGLKGRRVVNSSRTGQEQQVEMLSLSELGRSRDGQTLMPPEETVLAFAEVEGMREALVGTTAVNSIVVWNLKTGQLLRKMHVGYSYPASVCHRAYSDSGLLFVVLSHPHAKESESCGNPAFRVVAFNPKTARSTGVMFSSLPPGQAGRYLEGDVRDASAAAVLTSGAIAVWDLLLGQCTALLPPGPRSSWALARWATAGACLLAGQRDGTVCLYRYRQPQPGAA